MFDRRRFVALTAAALATPSFARPRSQGHAFAYFTNADHGKGGMRLAVSRNGKAFVPVRNGAPLFAPASGANPILRDPSIAYDPRTGLYHAVWTNGWFTRTIGHASSSDLLEWSTQNTIEVMAPFPQSGNTWAPELYFDRDAGHFVIMWSSAMTGKGGDSDGLDPSRWYHRIYATTTRDFREYSPTRLLFDPGFSVIDAAFARFGRKLFMLVKDERHDPLRKVIYWCAAKTPLGPFGPLSPSLTPAWSEGPTGYALDGEMIVLFDRYKEGRFGAVASRNMRDWRDISDQISLPAGASHGTVFPLPTAMIDRLLAA